MKDSWEVWFAPAAKKQYKKLHFSGQKKPSIIDLIDLLVMEIQGCGQREVIGHTTAS